MRTLCSTQAIFRQLAHAHGPASDNVKTVIENHDAWLHNADAQIAVSAALRLHLARSPRPESVTRRIFQQRASLDALVTRVATRFSSAG